MSPSATSDAQLLGIVHVAWSGAALAGLAALGVQPAIQNLIVGFVNNWATNSAPGWMLGTLHQYPSHHPQYVATAQLAAINGNDRTVNIVAFV